MGASRGLARVRREALAACMTCPLCQGLLREATAIAECLHTFCRECIMEGINDEQIDSCPVCNIDLGCDPEEKLRPDHNIQDIRNKVFPLKRTTADAHKAPTVSLPVKRKQRSLSSLVVDSPRVATPTSLTGRRTKASRRTTPSHPAPGNNGTTKLPTKSEGRDQKTEKFQASQSTKMTTTANKKQNNTDIESSSQPSSESRKNGKTIDKEELHIPLNSLAEVAGRNKLLKPSPKSQGTKVEKIKSTKCVFPVRKYEKENKMAAGTRVSVHSSRLKLQEKNSNSSESAPSKDETTTEDNLSKKKQGGPCQELLASVKTDALHDALATSVWFSLVASPSQKEESQLPQLPKNYLRIKDGSLQILSIQRYIMNKLELESEDEVEITCHGESICPSTTLQVLLEMGARSEPAEQVQASVGASAKEFVMVLGYRRRQRAPAS